MKDSYNRLKEKSGEMLFDIITDIPESLLSPAKTPQKRCELLTRKAAAKTAALSATLSLPGGFSGIVTLLPDIVSIWKIQAQLVADIAMTYGKYAELSREAMLWCLFRHSASQLLRDIFVRSGTRLIAQKVSFSALQKILQKIGISQANKFLGKTALRSIPLLGAAASGFYAYYDTKKVGETAETYFQALSEKSKTNPCQDFPSDSCQS